MDRQPVTILKSHPNASLEAMIGGRLTVEATLHRSLAILVITFALILGATLSVVKVTSDYLLHQNAASSAYNWAHLFVESLTDIEQIAAGQEPSQASLAFLEWSQRSGRLFRGAVYDSQGSLKLVSEDGVDRFDRSEPSAEAIRAVLTNEPISYAREGRQPDRPSLYAQAYVPVFAEGKPVAVVATYVDQTERQHQFYASFLKTAAVLSLLTCLAFGIPTVAWYRRTKEKLAADRRVVDSIRRGDLLAEEAKAQHQRLEATLTNMPHGLCMFDAQKSLVMCNARYTALYNLPPHIVQPGTPLREIIDYRQRMGTAPLQFPNYATHDGIHFTEGNNNVFEFELEDGRTIRINHLPLSGGGYIATHEDVTESIRAETRIRHLVTYDALTNLPNRAFFRERLKEAIAGLSSENCVAVLYLDLDHFKTVNDTLGHPAGDTLLSAVTARLRNCVEAGATIARLGGDEFAIIQTGSDQAERSSAVARKIINAISEPFNLEGQQVAIGVSVGIALAPNDGDDPDRLLKNAELALYRAKGDGRGIHCFFEPILGEKVEARRRLEVGLRRALVQEEFEIHYQPLVRLHDNAITGFEALLRWRDPERGLVSPGEFIPVAEETGLIGPIGDWVIRRACADAANWPHNLVVAVNLSPVQFKEKHVVKMVLGALGASYLPPSRLELEITESVLLNKSDDTIATLHQLRELGVRISMDDFGTGYSSLSYLRSFPFDKIKIDQSFIRDLPASADSLAIVRAVTGLGAALGVTTTAEGVETAEQLDCLRREGCTEVQGFLIGRPRPSAHLSEFLTNAKWSDSVASSDTSESDRPQLRVVR